LSDVPFKNPASGSERVLHHQVYGLVERGIDVMAITRDSGTGPTEYTYGKGLCEATYHANPVNPVSFLRSVLVKPRKILRQLESIRDYSAILSHQPFSYAALLLRRALKAKPSIYVFHSPSHEEYQLSSEYVENFKNYLFSQIRRIVENFCVKKAGKVIVLSHYMASKVQEIHNIDSKKIRINPGGVDIKKFYPGEGRGQIKEELSLPPEHIHLLTIRNDVV